MRRFVTRHPDAVMLDLGAGLDGRMFRVNPPPTVDWYDIDFPEVLVVRRQVLPQRTDAMTSARSSTGGPKHSCAVRAVS